MCVHVSSSTCPNIGYTRAGIASLAVLTVAVLEAIAIANRDEKWDELLTKLKDLRSKELEYQNKLLVVSKSLFEFSGFRQAQWCVPFLLFVSLCSASMYGDI